MSLEPKTIYSSSFWQKDKRKKVKKSYTERAGRKKERRRRRKKKEEEGRRKKKKGRRRRADSRERLVIDLFFFYFFFPVIYSCWLKLVYRPKLAGMIETRRNFVRGGTRGFLVLVCTPVRDFLSILAGTERYIQLQLSLHTSIIIHTVHVLWLVCIL